MNREREFISDAFHLLAQPVTALRLSMEQSLSSEPEAPAMRQTMQECLQLIDRMMSDLAVFREIASVESAALAPQDGHKLLRSCVEEMKPVTEECGTALHLTTEPANIECDEALFRRAMFLMLDEMIACAPRSGISIALGRDDHGVSVDMHPGTLDSQRQKLCRKLFQHAGAIAIEFLPDRISLLFKEHS